MNPFFWTAIFSYLLGSVPFGYILVRIFRGEDVRQSGSGNIGATNVSRTSPALGVLTLLLDALKGATAVIVVVLLSRNESPAFTATFYSEHLWDLHPRTVAIRIAVAALFVILGHMFPVWLKFRGGKGVATGLGAFLMVAPKAILVTIGIFAVILLIFHYVSLASMIAVACFPFVAWFLHDYAGASPVLAFMAVSSILIIVKHHENIRRLLTGTENRFQMRRG